MAELRWPDHRGRFVDHDPDRVQAVDGDDASPPMVVRPGDVISADDSEVVDHYIGRGFDRVDDDSDDAGGPDGDADTDDEQADTDSGFDAETFVDRTPVADVVDDIEAGKADGHLDAVADADGRATTQKAVEDRKAEIGGD